MTDLTGVTGETEVTVLYDSLCPVCRREVNLLKRFDRRGRLGLIDIASPNFNPEDFNLTMAECVGSLHALDASGKVIRGMDTIRAMYRAAGLGWVMSWTAVWPFRPLADIGYSVFARVRPTFSGFKPQCDSDGRCQVPPPKSPKAE